MSSHKDRKTKNRTKPTAATASVALTASRAAGAKKPVSLKPTPKAVKAQSASMRHRGKAKNVAAKAKSQPKVKSKPELATTAAASGGRKGKPTSKPVAKGSSALVGKSKSAPGKSAARGNARAVVKVGKTAAPAAKSRVHAAGTVEGNIGKMSGGKTNGAQANRSKANGTSGRTVSTAVEAARDANGHAPAPVAVIAKGEAGASGIVVPAGYRPIEGEPFMSERQRAYFRTKLIAWKDEIVRQNRETLQGLHEDSVQHADIADRATFETDRALELRARDRQRKLIAKIESALARIDDRSYGYCEETGEPISLKRLEARPIATLSIEAQERHERRERVFREE